MDALVSIITPAYNCEKTIKETIDSVLLQTYENWEMIIVDDSSTDNTLNILCELSNTDHRIKIYHLKNNSGAAAAKNYAIEMASGRYLAFLDSDDLWKKEKLTKQISFMQKNNCCFSYTGYEFFHCSSDKNRRALSVPKSVTYKKYLGNTIIGNSTVVIDRNYIPGFKFENGYLEDVLTWMFYLKKGFIAFGIDENLMSYRVYHESKSGNKFKNAKRYFYCLRKIQKIPFVFCLFYEFLYLINATAKRLFAKNVKYE